MAGATACPHRISHVAGANVSANWCRSTARRTPGSKTAAHSARCWRSSTMQPVGFRLFPADPPLSRGARQAGGVLQRQAQHLPRKRQVCRPQRAHHPVRPRLGGAEHRYCLANILQAKGRVERAFVTLQDELVRSCGPTDIRTSRAAHRSPQSERRCCSCADCWCPAPD